MNQLASATAPIRKSPWSTPTAQVVTLADNTRYGLTTASSDIITYAS